MSIKFVLFDLDGTLLPMDQDIFAKYYFGTLASRLSPLGYEKEALIKSIWAGTAAMVCNDGQKTNEEAFWDKFTSIWGEGARSHLPEFEAYYEEDFPQVKASCDFDPTAAEAVKATKAMGLCTALATNPIFPEIATRQRIAWAGLSPDDFELFTTYEHSCHCKPNLKYYQDVLEKLGAKPEECLMVGNDVGEDMIAREIGMQVFLLTDCIINKSNDNVEQYSHGGFDDLFDWLKKITA